MFKRVKQIGIYLASSLFSIVIYGLVMYIMFSWLAEYSLLYAYLGNIALIIFVLLIDDYTLKAMQSKRLRVRGRTEEEKKKYVQSIQSSMGFATSFKTDLYVLSVLFLIIAKTIEIEPSLAGARLSEFFFANNYIIVFIIAFDQLVGQFSANRERTKMVVEKLREAYPEYQDKQND